MLSAFAFGLGVAFWPGIASASIAPRWALLSVGLPLILARTRVSTTPGHWLLFALWAWAAISLLWTLVPYDGVNALWQLSLMAAAFLIGAELPSLRPIYLGLSAAMGVCALISLFQLAGHSPVPEVVTPGGLFLNKDMMAEVAAPVLVAATLLRLSPLAKAGALLGPLICVVSAGYRGAILGLVVALLAWLWDRSKLMIVAIILACVVLLAVDGERATRLPSIAERAAIWRDTIDGLTLWGRGVGSFYSAYPEHATRENTAINRPDHAHDEPLEYAFELGLPGVLLLGALVLLAMAGPRFNRVVLACLLGESLVGFPLHLPITAFLAALVAGRLCGGGHRLRRYEPLRRASGFLARPCAALADGIGLRCRDGEPAFPLGPRDAQEPRPRGSDRASIHPAAALESGH